MFNIQRYYKKITDAGMSKKEALVMVKMMKDLDVLINSVEKEKEDERDEIQCN